MTAVRKTLHLDIKLDEHGFMPEKAHRSDAGFDIKSPVDVWVRAGGNVTIKTGVHIRIPDGYVGFLKSKSGLNVNRGIVSEGVIDAGYLGEIAVKLYNHSEEFYHIRKGDKITQIVFLPIPDVELCPYEGEWEATERGSNGFGSTGR